MNETKIMELWSEGAKASLAGISRTKGMKNLGIGRYDHDERKAFCDGWIDMQKFMFMSNLMKNSEIAK